MKGGALKTPIDNEREKNGPKYGMNRTRARLSKNQRRGPA